jgi:hypothetical protein
MSCFRRMLFTVKGSVPENAKSPAEAVDPSEGKESF